MKAAVYTQYGPPEVVTIQEVMAPSPRNNEVLVRVHATTVNRNDCGFRTPEYPAIIRPIHGLFRPRKTILGTEFAGVVEAAGKDVQSLKVGDRVFGLTGNHFGTHAEYVCVRESGAISAMPSNCQFDEAVAILDGPWLALNLLRALDLKRARKILINGASGSIGSACVQLAKHFGAEITAVCSTRSLDIIRSLGADRLLDYAKEDFTKLNETFDAVIDAVGKSSFPKCKHLLNKDGFYLSSEFGDWIPQNPLLSLWTSLVGGKQVRFPLPRLNKADILFFKELAENGKLIAVIDCRFPLEHIVDAYRYVQTGQKIGNVVITFV